jgi:hypothetical protein
VPFIHGSISEGGGIQFTNRKQDTSAKSGHQRGNDSVVIHPINTLGIKLP